MYTVQLAAMYSTIRSRVNPSVLDSRSTIAAYSTCRQVAKQTRIQRQTATLLSQCRLHRIHAGRSFATSVSHNPETRHEEPFTALNLAGPPLCPVSWSQFDSSASRPLLLQGDLDRNNRNQESSAPALQLLSALRKGQDRVVDVELGRYDDITPDGFHQVSMRLGQYLDWLQSERTSGRVGGKQIYLAQWIGHGEIKAVHDIARPPSALSKLISEENVDLYQSALFLGPTGAVTPLHYDPYVNLFRLQASSAPDKYAKHVLLLPPSATPFIRGADARRRQHNTSTLDFHLRADESHGRPRFQVAASFGASGTSSEARDVIERDAVTCILRENETLFIPRGWWHRVENVALQNGSDEHGGWTAGLSYWFLPRSG